MKVFHKFHAKRCESDGLKFPSQKERDYYLYLQEKKKSGDLLFHLRQIPFQLDGGIKYFLDFMEFWKTDNPETSEIRFTEVKGLMTPVAKIKLAQTESLYPIKINIK